MKNISNSKNNLLPNFLIIGTHKAGTTSLIHHLKEHPQIYLPRRDTKFFCFEGNLRAQKGNPKIITDINKYKQLFDAVTSEKSIGEASNTYLANLRAPSLIKKYIPKVKLICLLRNPVDAIYSRFMMKVARGSIDYKICNFDQHIDQGHKPHFYSEGIKRYLDLFSKNQMRFYLFEDFTKNTGKVLQDIFDFLDVDPFSSKQLSKKYNASGMPNKNLPLYHLLVGKNAIKDTIKNLIPKSMRKNLYNTLLYSTLDKKKMSSDTKKKLISIYREDILKMQELLKVDLSHWLTS